MPMPVLTLPIAKRHIGAASTVNDDHVLDVIAEAESHVTSQCGPLVSTAITRRVRPGGMVGSTTYDLFARSGVLEGSFSEAFYDVVYQAGWDPLPVDLLAAVKEYMRYLWLVQRGPATGVAGTNPMEPLKRYEELAAPYVMAGFS
jgi:hypothetical protein